MASDLKSGTRIVLSIGGFGGFGSSSTTSIGKLGIGGGAGGGESRNRAGRRVLRFGKPDGRNSRTGVGSLAYIFISYMILYIVILLLTGKVGSTS